MTSSLPSPRTIEGIHWSDLMSNEELRRKTDQPDIVSIITRCRVLVIGHVLRRPDVHPTVVIYQVDLQFANQRGPHGRPRIHWKDVSRQDFQYINLALEGVPALCWRDKMALVISRHSWRNLAPSATACAKNLAGRREMILLVTALMIFYGLLD